MFRVHYCILEDELGFYSHVLCSLDAVKRAGQDAGTVDFAVRVLDGYKSPVNSLIEFETELKSSGLAHVVSSRVKRGAVAAAVRSKAQASRARKIIGGGKAIRIELRVDLARGVEGLLNDGIVNNLEECGFYVVVVSSRGIRSSGGDSQQHNLCAYSCRLGKSIRDQCAGVGIVVPPCTKLRETSGNDSEESSKVFVLLANRIGDVYAMVHNTAGTGNACGVMISRG